MTFIAPSPRLTAAGYLPSGNIGSFLPPFGTSCPTGLGQGIFDEKVSQVCEETQAPLPLAIQGMLAVGSCLFQGIADVEKHNGKTTPISVFCVGIVDSGECFSSIENSYTGPVHEILDEYKITTQEEQRKFEQDLEVWNATRQALIREISKTESNAHLLGTKTSDSTLIASLKEKLRNYTNRKPERPSSSGLTIYNSINPASFQQAINNEHTLSTALFTSEGEPYFSSRMKSNFSSEKALWDGSKISKADIASSRPSLHSRFSLYIQIQPVIAEELLRTKFRKAQAKGFLARSLISFPPTNQGYRRVTHPPQGDSRDQTYRHRIREFIEVNSSVSKNKEHKRTTLKLSKGAKELAYLVAYEIEIKTRPGDRFSGFGDHSGILADNIIRVAAIITIWDYGLDSEISRETFELAMHICCFFSDEYIHAFHELPQEEKDVINLDHWICQKRQRGERRYILKRKALTHGPLNKADRLDIALENLRQRGSIDIFQVPRFTNSGRRTKPTTLIDLYPGPYHDHNLIDQVSYGF